MADGPSGASAIYGRDRYHFAMLLFLNPTSFDTLTSGVFAGADATEGANR
jgi:hypothetical protein